MAVLVAMASTMAVVKAVAPKLWGYGVGSDLAMTVALGMAMAMDSSEGLKVSGLATVLSIHLGRFLRLADHS